MAYRRLIDKFTAAYELSGIYLHDSGRIIPLNQKYPKGLIILRENLNKLSREGISEISYQNEKYGVVITATPGKSFIVLLATFDRITVLNKHWNRILPAILKSLPVEEIVEEESPITQLARLATKINELFDEMIKSF